MKFTKEQLKELCFEDHDPAVFEIIELEDWVDEGKYATQLCIFRHGAKCYSTTFTRTGDYHRGYEYEFNDEDCPEMEYVKVVTKEWRVKKDD